MKSRSIPSTLDQLLHPHGLILAKTRSSLTPRVSPASKSVLLPVTRPENVVPRSLGGNDSNHAQRRQSDRVESQVPGLQGVGEGDPGEVTDGEHEPEPVRRDVHRGQYRGLSEEQDDLSDMRVPKMTSYVLRCKRRRRRRGIA